ncbi:MAG: DinB family protein [Nostocoides sp.]
MTSPTGPTPQDAYAAPPASLSLRFAAPDRVDPPRIADEKSSLTAYLEFYRATLEAKCSGLTADQLNDRSIWPSTMSLHGLVRHLAGVERWWFRINFAHEAVPMLFYTDEEPDLDFDGLADDPLADLAIWRSECEESRRVVAAAGLDDTGAMIMGAHDAFSLRWLMLRMISEYAQHCGHADLLRERADGSTGA